MSESEPWSSRLAHVDELRRCRDPIAEQKRAFTHRDDPALLESYLMECYRSNLNSKLTTPEQCCHVNVGEAGLEGGGQSLTKVLEIAVGAHRSWNREGEQIEAITAQIGTENSVY